MNIYHIYHLNFQTFIFQLFPLQHHKTIYKTPTQKVHKNNKSPKTKVRIIHFDTLNSCWVLDLNVTSNSLSYIHRSFLIPFFFTYFATSNADNWHSKHFPCVLVLVCENFSLLNVYRVTQWQSIFFSCVSTFFFVLHLVATTRSLTMWSGLLDRNVTMLFFFLIYTLLLSELSFCTIPANVSLTQI